ncbi:hypothetical protein LAZ67_7002260 [Cordylochernes scorpioides]|uniref:Mos1 transposase HTH domain-containing protein n=1 Tax=Cordylochernes scorpioides TaxID=51811 RepID=A0ABY6KNZ3_9ARAC|nr:hypothetical protein LAZ67_7002260 [Cordylochernes scorpioides]
MAQGSCSQMSRVSASPVIVAVYACSVDVEKGPIRQQLWNAPPCDNVESWGYPMPFIIRITPDRTLLALANKLCKMYRCFPGHRTLLISHQSSTSGTSLDAVCMPCHSRVQKTNCGKMVEREWRAIPQDLDVLLRASPSAVDLLATKPTPTFPVILGRSVAVWQPFAMELPLSSPAKCELRLLIRFLNAKNNSPLEIHRQLVEVYGEKCMDIKNVQKWCRKFNEGRMNVHDEQRSGRPSLPESTVARIDEMVRANRRITLEEIEDGLNEDCSHFSLHKIVSETLGYRKVSARWVDKWLKEAAGEWYNTGITKIRHRVHSNPTERKMEIEEFLLVYMVDEVDLGYNRRGLTQMVK